jgi:phosphodiesterase/alkaline phosphatase D-like protein
MTAPFDRRLLLKTGMFGLGALGLPGGTLAAMQASLTKGFSHGVASGEPSQNSVLLWTRFASDMADTTLKAEISEYADFRSTVAGAQAVSSPQRDYTAKAILRGLKPGQSYFYRFIAPDGSISPTGQTRTLPEGGIKQYRMAIFSCSNMPFGWFNAYAHAAQVGDFDISLHLGDYIYEYQRGDYPSVKDTVAGRLIEPANEIVSLADYRLRYASYRADPDLQAIHARAPMLGMWDDHEFANDAYADGAQNHQANEGDWQARKRAALQAYYEWMPIRDPENGRSREAIFRAFSFGDLLTVTALETRLMTRTKDIEYNEVVPSLTSPERIAEFRDKILWAPDRELIGAEQLAFIKETFEQSVAAGQPWRLIANQVIMAKVTAPNLEPHMSEENIAELEAQWDQARAFVKFSTLGLPTNLDAWDGYPASREKFYEAVKASGADGLVVVTGDTHTWWANDLVDRNGRHMGVELGVHSVSSPSPYRKSFLGGKGAEYALLTGKDNKDVRYISGEDTGYISLTVTRDAVDAGFVAVDTIETPQYRAFEKAAFTIKKSAGAAQYASVRGLSLKERAVF